MTPATHSQSGSAGWDGQADALVIVKVAAGARGLYLAATVTDDYWIPQYGWLSTPDAITFYLDSLPSAQIHACQTVCLTPTEFLGEITDFTKVVVAPLGSSDTQSSIGYFTCGITQCEGMLWLGHTARAADSLFGLAVDYVTLDSAHRAVELRLPWSMIAQDSSALTADSLRVGFTVTYTDGDSGSSPRSVLTWCTKDPMSMLRASADTLQVYWGDILLGRTSAISRSLPEATSQRTPLGPVRYYDLSGRRRPGQCFTTGVLIGTAGRGVSLRVSLRRAMP